MSNKELKDEDVTRALEHFLEIGEGTRFKKGQSGNPRGRPIQPEGLTETLAWLMSKTNSRALAQKLIDKALGGDLKAIQYIYDRLEGKPTQFEVREEKGEHPLVSLLRESLYDNKALEGKRVAYQLSEPRDAEPAEEALSDDS